MNVGTVVRDIVIRNRAEGAQETTAALKGVGQAYELVARVTETTSKNQLSMEQSFDRLERRLSATARAQFEYEKAQRQVNNAVAQNPALQERANAVLAELERRYQQVAQAADRAAAAQKQAAQTAVNRQTIMPDRASDIAAYGVELDRLRAKYNPLWAAGQQYKQTLTEINMAARVGAISDRERATALQATKDAFAQQVAVLRGVATSHAVAGQSVSTHAKIIDAAQSSAAMYAGRLGSLGFALTSLGPAGIAAGAALGVVVLGLSSAVKAATDLAERSGKLVDFAESTGLTTTALQALNKAGAEVGMNQEKVGTIVERFTTQLAQLRKGEGELFKELMATDQALVDQLASTNDVAKAWDIMSRAIAGATDQIERNRLTAAVSGRRNISAVRLFTATDQAGGIGGLTERAGLIVSDQELRRWDELGDKITITSQQAKTAWASIYSDAVLNASLKFHETNLAIATTARDFTLSSDFKRWLDFMTAPPRAALSSLFDPAQLFRSPAPPSKTGADDARGANTEAEQASLVLSRQLLAVQNELTNQFSLQMQAITARTAEERIALAVEQRRVELSKTSISDVQLATELERTRTLAVARSAASHRDAMTAMSGQLAIAQAVTAQERMGVQQLVTYNQLRDQGRSHEQATLEALMQRQVTQAQINSNAEGQLRAAQDQFAIISATTETEKLRATEVARINELMRQSVDPALAASIAAQERLNTERQIEVALERQIIAQKRAAAAEAERAAAAERHAAAIEMAEWQTGVGRHDPWGVRDYTTGKSKQFNFQFDTTPSGQGFTSPWGPGGAEEVPGQLQMGRLSRGYRPYVYGGGYIPNEQGFEFQVDEILKTNGSLDAAIAHLNKYLADVEPWDEFANPQAAMGVLRELFDLQSFQAGGDTSQQQQFLEQQIRTLESQPKTLENLRLLRELKDSLDSLRESTDALNTTIGLDPLYTQGHGYVGIGYNPHGGTSPRIPIDPNTVPYVPSLAQPMGAPAPAVNRLPMRGSMTSPGTTMIDPRSGRPVFGMATGGMFMVGGSGTVDSKYVPLALTPGELIEVTPETHHLGGKQQTVINNVSHNNTFNFPPSRSYGDRRTQRHMTEGFGRAMAQAR